MQRFPAHSREFRHFPHPGMVVAALAALLFPTAPAAQQPPPAADTAAAETAAPAPTGLTLPEAVARALENSPEFLQQRNNMDAARWSVRVAALDFLPKANASTSLGYTAAGERRFGSVGFGSQPDYYSSDYNVGLSLDLSGAKLLQPAVSRSRYRATERQIEGAAANLEATVTQQYLAVLQAQENVAQAEREVARTAEYVRLAQARLEVGAGTPLDVRRAEVQQGQAEIQLVQARNAVATAKLNLGQLIGAPLDPEVPLTSEFVLFEPNLDTEALVEAALRTNPVLLASRASENAARTEVKQARTAYLPSLNFNVGWRGSVYQAGDIDPLVRDQLRQSGQQFQACQEQNLIRQRVQLPTTPCFDPTVPGFETELRSQVAANNSGFPFDWVTQPLSASVTVSLPLFTGFARQLQVEQAQAQASDVRLQVRAEELRLRSDVAIATENIRTAYQTAQIQERVRATAEEELRMARERFRFGAANSVEVTDAQTNLAEAERALIDVIYNFHQSLAALEALVGEPLR